MRDQFEWDLNSSEAESSPEHFSKSLCADLGLSREFQVAISHSIREQIITNRKLAKTHEFKEREVIVDCWRSEEDLANWTPTLSKSF